MFSLLKINLDALNFVLGGVSKFREFLIKEFSEENLSFWLACEELTCDALWKSTQRHEMALKIYELHIKAGSKQEVRSR